jgi:hypothetical protein
MTFVFRIQASNPRWLRVFNKEDNNICDAMQTVFPSLTEYAYMVWNGIHIPMDYKYIVSFLVQDAIMILEAVSKEARGSLSNRWPSNDFASTWHMNWSAESLEIQADWESVLGGTEALLNARPIVRMGKDAFMSEWKQVLGIAFHALIDAGYTNRDLSDLERLRQMYESISEPGVLYREPA